MPWKSTTPWLVGLVAAAGLVWFKRGERSASSAVKAIDTLPEIEESAIEALELNAPPPAVVSDYVRAERDELRALADADRDTEVPPAPVEMARTDALHDMRLDDRGEIAEDDLDDDDDNLIVEQYEVNVFDSEPGSWEEGASRDSALDLRENVHPSEHVVAAEETYDAMDTEDLGAEWLLRATEAGGPQERAPEEMLEGMQLVIDMNENLLDESEVPLVVDVTEELPLGEYDRAGNAELHGHSEVGSRVRERGAFSGLLPTERELSERAAAERVTPAAKRKRQI